MVRGHDSAFLSSSIAVATNLMIRACLRVTLNSFISLAINLNGFPPSSSSSNDLTATAAAAAAAVGGAGTAVVGVDAFTVLFKLYDDKLARKSSLPPPDGAETDMWVDMDVEAGVLRGGTP